MISLRANIAFTLIIGLLLGYIIDQSSSSTVVPAVSPQPSVSPAPFTTRGSVLVVTIVSRRESPPSIKQVTTIEQGRLTPNTSGNSTLTLLDATSATLYKLNFQPNYLSPGEPPDLLNEVTLLFIIPSAPTMKRITVTSPNGSDTKEIVP